MCDKIKRLKKLQYLGKGLEFQKNKNITRNYIKRFFK